jgi:hypothetical protein
MKLTWKADFHKLDILLFDLQSAYIYYPEDTYYLSSFILGYVLQKLLNLWKQLKQVFEKISILFCGSSTFGAGNVQVHRAPTRDG